MQIIPESGMSFQCRFNGKSYLTKYTQQGKIVKKRFPTNQQMIEYISREAKMSLTAS